MATEMSSVAIFVFIFFDYFQKKTSHITFNLQYGLLFVTCRIIAFKLF